MMKLEQTILQLRQKINTKQDTVQINALDFDPDIDGPHLTPSELEILDATEFQAEDDTSGESSNFIYNNSEECHGYDDFPQDFQNHTTEHDHITPGNNPDSENIPELEED